MQGKVWSGRKEDEKSHVSYNDRRKSHSEKERIPNSDMHCSMQIIRRSRRLHLMVSIITVTLVPVQ